MSVGPLTASLPAAERRGRIPTGAVVVGIPSRNEALTIARVVTAAIDGLRAAGLAGRAVLVNADNGSTDGTPERFSAAAGSTPHLLVPTSPASSAKGTNVVEILRVASELDAERVVLLDADVRTIEVTWVPSLLTAVDTSKATLAVPVYRRNRFEGNTTNHIARPLVSAVFGVNVQQPIAGDFAFNRAFVQDALTWTLPASALLYGIDIHLTARAALAEVPIREVRLGRKLHNPGFPKILFGSQQVIDSLFHVISSVRQCTPAPIGRLAPSESTDAQTTRPDPAFVAHSVAKVLDYLSANVADITDLLPTVADAPRAAWGYRVDVQLWARLLADALQALSAGHLAQARDHLVALYLCRVMTYWEEIEHLRPVDVDALLDEQTEAVVAEVAARNIRFSGAVPPPGFDAGYWAPEPS